MPSPPKPINSSDRVTHSIRRSFTSSSPIVQASLARDIAEASDSEGVETDGDYDLESSTLRPTTSTGTNYSFAGSYRRPSFAGAGNRATVVPYAVRERDRLSKAERQRVLEEERSLLRDNNLIPPKHPQDEGRRKSLFARSLSIPSGVLKVRRDGTATPPLDGARPIASEVSPLLGDADLPYGGQDDAKNISAKWEEA